MEALLTERYSINGQSVPSAQSTSDRGEVASGLRWDRKSNCEDLIRGGTYQNKKKKLARCRLEAGACQEQLVQQGASVEQNGLEENGLQQKTHGEHHPFQDLLGLLLLFPLAQDVQERQKGTSITSSFQRGVPAMMPSPLPASKALGPFPYHPEWIMKDAPQPAPINCCKMPSAGCSDLFALLLPGKEQHPLN